MWGTSVSRGESRCAMFCGGMRGTVALRLTGEGVNYLRDGTALDINDLPDPRQPLGKLGIADINLEPRSIGSSG